MTDVEGGEVATDPPEAPAPGRPRTALVTTVVVAVVVGLLVALLATRDSGTAPAPSPLIGKASPDVAGDTIDGGRFDLADHRGQWVVLNFFASWCVPCLEEHPELLSFDAAHRSAGDAVLVSTTFDDRAEDARAFFDEHGGTWPVIDDPENRLGVAFGVAQVPETFVISPTGIVVQRYTGAVERGQIEDLIASYERAAEESQP